MRAVTAIFLLMMVGVLCGCNSATEPVSAAAPPPRVVRPAAEPASNEYTTSAPLLVENQVDVLAQRDGLVAEIVADAGASVQKGQVLARLDDRQLRADYDGAQSRLASMKANRQNFDAQNKILASDLSRAEELLKIGVLAQQQVDHARYQVEEGKFQTEREQHYVEEQEAKVRGLKLELEKSTVIAPFAGVVARRYTRLGQKVSANDRMFWVTATAPIKVQFTLPETFAGRVQRGEQIAIFSPVAPEVAHAARITMVSPVVDPASGTIDVQAQVETPSADLRPGMTATVRVKKSQ
jgi:membrane fusion protein (multidrug efflux system)